MSLVKAKKHLGQHFLTDKNIAEKIVNSLKYPERYDQILEVGPGMGILSDFLLSRDKPEAYLIDIDNESFDFLNRKYPGWAHGSFMATSSSWIFRRCSHHG
jgi:16S rRNA (adenine1518-N6/adenine1519-N6)-dimethyltransferase